LDLEDLDLEDLGLEDLGLEDLGLGDLRFEGLDFGDFGCFAKCLGDDSILAFAILLRAV